MILWVMLKPIAAYASVVAVLMSGADSFWDLGTGQSQKGNVNGILFVASGTSDHLLSAAGRNSSACTHPLQLSTRITECNPPHPRACPDPCSPFPNCFLPLTCHSPPQAFHPCLHYPLMGHISQTCPQ